MIINYVHTVHNILINYVNSKLVVCIYLESVLLFYWARPMPMVCILDGKLKHVAHVRGKTGLFRYEFQNV